MQIQEYLRSGKTLVDLKTELGIDHVLHPTLPLIILNYSQIDSPKSDPLVRECRGLTLHSQDYSLVARSFYRFFNWGEMLDEAPLFDFSDFVVQSKEDGSLCILFYFQGAWHANTRGSFGLDPMSFFEFTWREAFCQALGVSSLQDLQLDTSVTYVCEFCSPYNKIVRRYPDPKMYLLTAFRGLQELSWQETDTLAAGVFLRPERFHFQSLEEIQAFLQGQATSDPTFEGVVICDRHGHRWKVKSPTYLALHRLRGEGDNLYHPKNLIPFILSGETSELVTYFPEVRETLEKYEILVQSAWGQLAAVWEASWKIESQKEFALMIVGKTPFTGLLFSLRKVHGVQQSLEILKGMWRQSGDAIVKFVFKK